MTGDLTPEARAHFRHLAASITKAEQDAAALDYAETALSEAWIVLRDRQGRPQEAGRGDDVSEHDFTTCDCRSCQVELLLLQDELDELERTDPDARAAAESYDQMVERITGRKMPPR